MLTSFSYSPQQYQQQQNRQGWPQIWSNVFRNYADGDPNLDTLGEADESFAFLFHCGKRLRF